MAQDEVYDSAERKQVLIAQGEAFRLGIENARKAVRANMSGETIAKTAVGNVAMAALSLLKGGALIKGGTLQILLPLVIRGISSLSRKSLLKPVARGALVVGAVAALTRFVLRRKKAARAARSK